MKRAAIVFVVLSVLASSAVPAAVDGVRTITVQGRAEIKVAPDEAVLNLGVEIFQADLEEAKANNDRIVSAVLAAARKHDISNDDLRTDRLYIDPSYTREGRKLQGFTVRQSIIIIVKDTGQVEPILSAVLQAGANQVRGIEYRTSNPAFHRQRARSMALDAAKEKAAAMAGQLGEKIGRPLEINEERWTPPRPMPFNATGYSGETVGASEGTMVAGRIAITAVVTVTFELIE